VNDFKTWLQKQYLTWQANKGELKTLVEFGDWLGVEQPTLSKWMNGKTKPRGASVMRLALRLGDEVYAVLGVEKPKHDGRLQAINEWWDALTEEMRDWLFTNASRQQATTALRERKETYGRKTRKNK
jgi:transcriptional regulator with XRE-family HTH domain